MSVLTDRLRARGADIDGAMRRMVDDEELYATCFAYFIDDPVFDALAQTMEKKDFPAAFDAAHTLKGVAGNLGLKRIYGLLGELVEPLRDGNAAGVDLSGPYRAVVGELKALKALTAD